MPTMENCSISGTPRIGELNAKRPMTSAQISAMMTRIQAVPIAAMTAARRPKGDALAAASPVSSNIDAVRPARAYSLSKSRGNLKPVARTASM